MIPVWPFKPSKGQLRNEVGIFVPGEASWFSRLLVLASSWCRKADVTREQFLSNSCGSPVHPIVQALPLGITMLCLTKSGSAYQVTDEYPGELAWDVRGGQPWRAVALNSVKLCIVKPSVEPLSFPSLPYWRLFFLTWEGRILLPLNSVDYLDEQSKSIRNAQ